MVNHTAYCLQIERKQQHLKFIHKWISSSVLIEGNILVLCALRITSAFTLCLLISYCLLIHYMIVRTMRSTTSQTVDTVSNVCACVVYTRWLNQWPKTRRMSNIGIKYSEQKYFIYIDFCFVFISLELERRCVLKRPFQLYISFYFVICSNNFWNGNIDIKKKKTSNQMWSIHDMNALTHSLSTGVASLTSTTTAKCSNLLLMIIFWPAE